MIRLKFKLIAIFIVLVVFNCIYFEWFEIAPVNDTQHKNHLPIVDITKCLGGKHVRNSFATVKKPMSNKTLTFRSEEYLNKNLLFIVGAMSSGTTLMRLILDVHPDVNCGDETKIVHLMLEFVNSVYRDRFYVQFMNNSGVRNETIDKATALFVYYMMENNKKNPDVDMSAVKYLCNKEPMNTFQMCSLSSMFPNSKFIYIVRDGRDVALSQIRRNKLGYNFQIFLNFMSYWNAKNKYGFEACQRIGPSKCLMIKYESLVREPRVALQLVIEFLGLEWVDDMMRHDEFLESNKISLSNQTIFSTIRRDKINNKSMGKWRDRFGKYEKLISRKFDMLKKLNY